MLKLPRFSAVTALAVAIFGGLIYLFAWSSAFTVHAITIQGAPTSESKSEISKLVLVATGEKMARVEPRAIATRIESIGWIKSVNISRHWLSGNVDVSVTPRTPTAYFNGSTIDASGAVFTLPGFSGGNLPLVSAAHPKIGLAAIELFQSLPKSFQSEVTSLSARDSADFTLHILEEGRDIRIAWGKNEKTALKIQVIKALLALAENKSATRIDVSAPHAPIVK